jgi:hypothetical protein
MLIVFFLSFVDAALSEVEAELNVCNHGQELVRSPWMQLECDSLWHVFLPDTELFVEV